METEEVLEAGYCLEHQRTSNLRFCQHIWLVASWVKHHLSLHEPKAQQGTKQHSENLQFREPGTVKLLSLGPGCSGMSMLQQKFVYTLEEDTVPTAVQFTLANSHKNSIPELNHMRFLNVLCCCCFKLQKNPSKMHIKCLEIWKICSPGIERCVNPGKISQVLPLMV